MSLLTLNTGEKIDFNYAETVIKDLKKDVIKTAKRRQISTSKLRKLLEPINTLYTQVHHDSSMKLSERVIEELEYIKVRFAYESGREPAVKTFVNKSHLEKMLDKVIENGDKKSFIYFCRYFEALVAYAKFHGMEDR